MSDIAEGFKHIRVFYEKMELVFFIEALFLAVHDKVESVELASLLKEHAVKYQVSTAPFSMGAKSVKSIREIKDDSVKPKSK